MGIHESVFFIFLFAMLFGIAYLFLITRHRERMNLIAKGLPLYGDRPSVRAMDHPLRSLKNGLLMIGVGIGAVLGYFFEQAVAPRTEFGPLPYIVAMVICGGIALVLFYIAFGRKQQG